MAIFNSYVSLPEGMTSTGTKVAPRCNWPLCGPRSSCWMVWRRGRPGPEAWSNRLLSIQPTAVAYFRDLWFKHPSSWQNLWNDFLSTFKFGSLAGDNACFLYVINPFFGPPFWQILTSSGQCMRSSGRWRCATYFQICGKGPVPFYRWGWALGNLCHSKGLSRNLGWKALGRLLAFVLGLNLPDLIWTLRHCPATESFLRNLLLSNLISPRLSTRCTWIRKHIPFSGMVFDIFRYSPINLNGANGVSFHYYINGYHHKTKSGVLGTTSKFFGIGWGF